LRNGAHIYVEKPFTLNKSEAAEVLATAEKAGLRVCAGHQVLFEEPARKAQELLKEIGSIVHVESYFSFRQVRRNISPVDQLIDILPHPVYTLLHFLKISKHEEKDAGLEIVALDVQSKGEVRAIVKLGNITGIIVVTLQGRPVESYLRIVGTNGSIYADFVHGTVVKLAGPGTSAVSIIQNPYKQARQVLSETTKSLVKMALKRRRGYPGLAELIEAFYSSILENAPEPVNHKSIVETVEVCEKIGDKLREAEIDSERQAEQFLRKREKELVPVNAGRKAVLVTGGTGFLGKKVAECLRKNGWPVRVVSRNMPPFSKRDPGVKYVVADLAEGIPLALLKDTETIIHCAAETSGGKEDHERNSVETTRRVLEASAAAGIKKFIHISSLAVLKPCKNSGKPLDETSPVDQDNLGRGPYVWGKAKAEEIAGSVSKQLGIDLKIIRPGPLVDFENFEAPGRLGREVGSYFVVMGNRRSKLNICDIDTVAKVVEYYLGNFESAPLILNLVEPETLSRQDLVSKLLKKRKDLKALYIPTVSIQFLSFLLKLLQKIISSSRKALDVAAAFASERYNTSLAREIISKASCN